MKKVSFIAVASLFLSMSSLAQDAVPPANPDSNYIKTIQTRAEKIVAGLKLTDSVRFRSAKARVADQYFRLNDVYTKRDAEVKAAKAELAADKPSLDARLRQIEERTSGQISALHASYLKDLSQSLSENQIALVKDGMTYNLVKVTYDAYLDMIPSLTVAQKAQLHEWLVEARELAMDAESSDKKHWWFGKYKGRINNYLSKEGYDIQKERQAWEQRLKERKAAKAVQ